MVPGSTLMYGSNFCSRTRRPLCSRSMPMEAQVSPLPRELTTPPVTKMCLVCLTGVLLVDGKPVPSWKMAHVAEGGGKHALDEYTRSFPFGQRQLRRVSLLAEAGLVSPPQPGAEIGAVAVEIQLHEPGQ